MKSFIFLIRREFRRFLANKTLRSVFFLAPLIYAFLIGMTYKEGKVTDIPVLVIDQDQTPMSAQLVDMLSDNQSLKISVYDQDPQRLKEEVIQKNAAAVLTIPDRFEAMLLQKKYPEITVHVNTSNVLTANYASKAIQLTLGTFSAGAEIKALQKAGMPAAKAATQFEPFKANYITLFNTTGNYLIFMWPAMMAVVLQQVILLAMAVTFSEELKRKSFINDFVKRKYHPVLIMLIKSLPVWVFSLVNIFIFFLYSTYFLIPSPVNGANFALITAVFILSCTNLGVFFSILIPDALKATQILMVIASPAFIISGFTWPRNAMPEFIQKFTDVIPLTPYLESLKIMIVQQGAAYLTRPYFWHLLVMALIYFVLAWLVLKFKLKNLYKLHASGKGDH